MTEVTIPPPPLTKQFFTDLAWLLVIRANDKLHVSVEYGVQLHTKLNSGLFSVVKRIPLSPEQAMLPMDDLIVLFSRNELKEFVVTEDDTAKAKRLETIIGYIKTSDSEGERSNARDAYKKLTGKDWVEL